MAIPSAPPANGTGIGENSLHGPNESLKEHGHIQRHEGQAHGT